MTFDLIWDYAQFEVTALQKDSYNSRFDNFKKQNLEK